MPISPDCPSCSPEDQLKRLEDLADKSPHLKVSLMATDRTPDQRLNLAFESILRAVQRNLDWIAAAQQTPSASADYTKKWRQRWRRCKPENREQVIATMVGHEVDAITQLVRLRVRRLTGPVTKDQFKEIAAKLFLPAGATWEMVEQALRPPTIEVVDLTSRTTPGE